MTPFGINTILLEDVCRTALRLKMGAVRCNDADSASAGCRLDPAWKGPDRRILQAPCRNEEFENPRRKVRESMAVGMTHFLALVQSSSG